jgi:prepilin-type N-terminal cleavage/methylation domain-containing protein
MKRSYMQNERGLTLIEVLAAIVILGIVVVAFLDISNFSLAAGKNSDEFEEAMRLAENRLSIARELVYTKPGEILDKPVEQMEKVDEFTVIYQLTNLSNPTPLVYKTDGFQSEHVSLQSIITNSNQANLLTVTVTWGDPP